ncbi:MAG: ATP-binding protein [Proteobacteria bacterium]|nr:MAG: ATP-binding protein [Pseudomonadota bacterium]
MTSQILKDLCDKVVSRNQLSLKEVVSQLRDFSLEQNVPAMAAYIATLESTNELDSAELLEAVFKYHSESRGIVDKFISLHESTDMLFSIPENIPNGSLSFYEENGCLAAECTSGKWTKLANNFKAARIPWRYYQQNNEICISSIESKLPLKIESDYFLTGETGSGKSTDAVRSLIGALNSGKTARYISCSDITDILENRASLKFERGYKAAVAVNHDNLKREMVDVDVLVIDEIVGISF